MEKSSVTTEQPTTFFGVGHAHLQEWIWACLLVILMLGAMAWQATESEMHWTAVPKTHFKSLLFWSEQLPGPPFRKGKGRSDNGINLHPSRYTRQPRTGFVEEDKRMEMNAADEKDWQRFRGIGPVISKRILGCKRLLGGFVDVDQLHLVYGLDASLVEDIKPMLCTEPSWVKTMCVEKVTFGE